MSAVSPWVARWSHLVAPGARVLDLACGSGRHTHWFAQRGAHVVAVDRNAEALAALTGVAHTRCLDLEQDDWPLAGEQFDAVVVTNYLWRPHLGDVLDLLAPGGVLLYETFHARHAEIGRPARAEFLLNDGELLRVCAPLHIHAFEEGFDAPRQRFVQRIAARRDTETPIPWPLPDEA